MTAVNPIRIGIDALLTVRMHKIISWVHAKKETVELKTGTLIIVEGVIELAYNAHRYKSNSTASKEDMSRDLGCKFLI